jgi:hypothetical protein
MFVVMELAALITWLAKMDAERHKFDWTPCGKTAASARAANCHYEVMQRSWIPDALLRQFPGQRIRSFRRLEVVLRRGYEASIDRSGFGQAAVWGLGDGLYETLS